jgi:hypothetical protein
MIKYNNNINKDILNLINTSSLSNLGDKFKVNSLIGLIKQRGVPSSVPIASAITSYAQADMMKFKNLVDNEIYYSDTDSALMEFPLPDKYIDEKELGKFKLVDTIIEGYFISPKFYAYNNLNGEIIKKTKGIKDSLISFEDFKSLSKGKDISLKTTVFSKNLKKGTVNISKKDIIIKGVCSNGI